VLFTRLHTACWCSAASAPRLCFPALPAAACCGRLLLPQLPARVPQNRDERRVSWQPSSRPPLPVLLAGLGGAGTARLAGCQQLYRCWFYSPCGQAGQQAHCLPAPACMPAHSHPAHSHPACMPVNPAPCVQCACMCALRQAQGRGHQRNAVPGEAHAGSPALTPNRYLAAGAVCPLPEALACSPFSALCSLALLG